jgi:HNH endonuclease
MRRSKQNDPEVIRDRLVALLTDFGTELGRSDLRARVQALVPAFHLLRDLGSSLIPKETAASGMDRILAYLRKYALSVIKGDELMVVAGIGEWARRVRQLRVEFGWAIINGSTAKEMAAEGDLPIKGIVVKNLRTDDYILLNNAPDLEAAHRWHVANQIRKKKGGVKAKILEFLRVNVGKPVTGEELRYIANNRSEWARRTRELRTELGWPVTTKSTGRPDLPVGVYLLEQDRQSPHHDRKIPDPIRRKVLRRDNYTCQNTDCGWNHDFWNPSDPRHLELHHKEHHVRGGKNTAENLMTICTVCHDDEHRRAH